MRVQKLLQPMIGMILILLLVGCGTSPATPASDQGFILYEVLDEDGRPTPELVVSDTDGTELHRITFPDLVLDTIPLRSSPRALVEIGGPTSQERKFYVVDAALGTAQELGFPEDAPSGMGYWGGVERYALFSDAPRIGNLVYLANLETGQVYDLTTPGGEMVSILSFGLSPDEGYVALETDGGLWLVPTANPGDARRLGGTGQRSGAVSFSDDGEHIVYSQPMGTDETEVVIEQVDGSSSEVILTGDGWVSATFVPNQDQLILYRHQSDEVSLLSLDDGREQELAAYREQIYCDFRLFAPSGQKVLVHCAGGETAWHLVDLGEGTSQRLEAIDEYLAILHWRGWGQRWLFIADQGPFPLVGETIHFSSVDLESGEVQQVVTLDEARYQLPRSVHSSLDGKFGLVPVRVPEGDHLWLLRADSGEARLLTESGSKVYGALSPDGRWAVVSTIEAIEGVYEATLTLMETEGDETRPLGKGVDPVWVGP